MHKLLFIIPAIALLSGSGAVALAGKKVAEPVRTVGEPKNCVTISQIRSTKVIDSRNIDFRMAGGKTYRNTLPQSCPGLKFPIERHSTNCAASTSSVFCMIKAGSFTKVPDAGLASFRWWRKSRNRAERLLTRPVARALLDKRSHAFLLIFRAK